MLKRILFYFIPIFTLILVFFFDRSSIDYKQGIQNIFTHFLYQEALNTDGLILYEVRLPRIFLAIGVGMILSGSGVIMQNIFRNPLVDPYLLGVSSGAAFGCAVCIGIFSQEFLGFFAFFGAVGAVFAIVFFSRFTSKTPVSLILVGIVLSSLLSALAGLIKYFVTPDKAQAIAIWLLGSVSLATWRDVGLVFIVILLGFLPLFLLRFQLNALALNDIESKSLGVNPVFLRTVCIFLVGLMCGIAVSVSGTIGWIGLIVPHFVRILVGANLIKLLPASIFMGGFVLLLMDFCAKNLSTNDLPVGAISAIVGAPLFLVFLILTHKSRTF
ncbi:FecCD family ABC transporter permease [Helicobacter anatolicus]|uniref:FecCD family ABC transporter permease n=1 Tax=Helicobacter anatolicus TaxID=2905874 RepID=UPI001E48D9A2|nr:iron ABC transporter permease [Helicobacter anatolicus]